MALQALEQYSYTLLEKVSASSAGGLLRLKQLFTYHDTYPRVLFQTLYYDGLYGFSRMLG